MLDAELTLVGPDGPVRGGSGAPTATGAIPVLEVRHTLVSPLDTVTGQPTGKRRHAPVVVVKEVDRSSPVLLNAWARRVVHATWRLDVFVPDRFGRRSVGYTIVLGGAEVSEIVVSTPEAPGLPREAVSFAYERITWTWAEGNVTASDDWRATV